MQYEPIKKSLGRFFNRSVFLRKILYFLLDLLLLRSWHVRKAVRNAAASLPEDAVVLDAGSGFGQYTWRMSSRYKKWTFTGIDINSNEIEDCNSFFTRTGRSARVAFKPGDLTQLSGNGIYDFILSVDVMEHIADDQAVFNNFFRTLRETGIVIISTPSDKGGSDVHHHNDSSFIDEHVRDGYGPGEISSKLSSAGFRKVNVRYTYGWPGKISWKLSMKYPVKMINTSYLFFMVLPFYYVIFFPVSFILNIFDVSLKHNSGTGLLVIAQK